MSVLDMKCPKCEQNKAFNICADIWGRYTVNGFDPEAKNMPMEGPIWDQYAGCQCPKCGHIGIVEDFFA